MNSIRSVEVSLPRTVWVKLICLRTGVGQFYLFMHKSDSAASPNCECGAPEQTTDYVLIACPVHRAPQEIRRLMVLDDESWCWLNTITTSI